jgi:error-prone DNA polymerase
MFTGQPAETIAEQQVQLPLMSLSEHVVQDYASVSLSLKAHPVSFVREKLSSMYVLSSKDLNHYADGALVKVAGLVLVRQRPGTASGICFITLEDETGIANLVVFAKLFEQFRKEILRAKLLMVEGRLQREGEVTHVIAQRCYDLSVLLKKLTRSEEETSSLLTLAYADQNDGSLRPANETGPGKKAQEGFHEGRNFR